MPDNKLDNDANRAIRDPEGVYSSPEQVRDDPKLTHDQKIEILHRWAYDAAEVAVAEEEGMSGPPPVCQQLVLRVLHELTGGDDTGPSPPTKFSGT